MRKINERCAGIDVGKRFLLCPVLTAAANEEPSREHCASILLIRLREWLVAERITHVVTSWAGLCSGNRESAGIRKGSQTTSGSPIPAYGVGAVRVGGSTKARLRIPSAISAVVGTTRSKTCHRGGSLSKHSLLDAEAGRTFSWFRNSITTTPATTAGPSSSQMSPEARPRGSNRGR